MRHGMLIICAIAATACAGEGRSGGSESWQAVVDTVADTITVRTVAGSVWGDTTTLVEEVRIGTLEGADEYILGDPRSIAVGEEGRIYLLDRQVPVVRAYSSDGTYLFDAGREGGGPGEYENVRTPWLRASRRPGQSCATPAPRASRCSHPTESSSRTGIGRTAVASTPAGASTPTPPATATPWYCSTAAPPPWEWQYGLVTISPTGEELDTIAALQRGTTRRRQLTASRDRKLELQIGAVHDHANSGRSARWATSRAGSAPITASTCSAAAHRCYASSASGRRYPVLDEEAEERRTNIRQGMQRQYGSWRWNGPPIPDTKPPFRDIIADFDGRIWVQVSQQGRATMTEQEAREEEQRSDRRPIRFEEPIAYDVFDTQGRFWDTCGRPTRSAASPSSWRAATPCGRWCGTSSTCLR